MHNKGENINIKELTELKDFNFDESTHSESNKHPELAKFNKLYKEYLLKINSYQWFESNRLEDSYISEISSIKEESDNSQPEYRDYLIGEVKKNNIIIKKKMPRNTKKFAETKQEKPKTQIIRTPSKTIMTLSNQTEEVNESL